MPHQCTKCGKIYPDASEELLKGCECGSKFFYYIKQERIEEIKEERSSEMTEVMKELDRADKEQIEKDIREITGMDKEPEKPVILDLESVKVIKPGKFEIDVINLFNKRRPLIYKLEEGKYIIDLAASMKVDKAEVAKKIRDPDLFLNKKDEENSDENKDDNDKKETKDQKIKEEKKKDSEDEKIEELEEEIEEMEEEIKELKDKSGQEEKKGK